MYSHRLSELCFLLVLCVSFLKHSISSLPLQTSSQTELENWITAIHSACATAVARQHHREDTVRLLRAETKKLEQKMDMDEKMKKMGDMQLSAVSDTKKRKTILEQVGVRPRPLPPSAPPNTFFQINPLAVYRPGLFLAPPTH